MSFTEAFSLVNSRFTYVHVISCDLRENLFRHANFDTMLHKREEKTVNGRVHSQEHATKNTHVLLRKTVLSMHVFSLNLPIV